MNVCERNSDNQCVNIRSNTAQWVNRFQHNIALLTASACKETHMSTTVQEEGSKQQQSCNSKLHSATGGAKQ